MSNRGFDQFLEGKYLYGDDFKTEEIQKWYHDEMESYADLGAGESETYSYQYHIINILHAYRYLPLGTDERVLGFGAAYGHEFAPIRDRIGELHIVEPSQALRSPDLFGLKVNYRPPGASGKLDYPDEYFDLITCFGTLHHIANVSTVLEELARTLKTGGKLLLREPIISMGDWRLPRKGLTSHERGIPLRILRSIIENSGLEIQKQTYCFFPITRRLGNFFGYPVYNRKWTVHIDRIWSWMFKWNYRYHRTKKIHMLAPDAVFLVVKKN